MSEAWALPPRDSPFGTTVHAAFAAAGLPVPRASVVTAGVWIRQAMCESGRFLTILPASVLRVPAKARLVAALPIDLRIRQQPIGIMTLKTRTISPVAQLVIEGARDLAKSFTVRPGSKRAPRRPPE